MVNEGPKPDKEELHQALAEGVSGVLCFLESLQQLLWFQSSLHVCSLLLLGEV